MSLLSSKSASTKYIDMVYVLDRSGSMGSMGGSHKNQLRDFLVQQKKAAETSGNTIFMTLVTFDAEATTCIDYMNMNNIDIPDDGLLYDWAEPRGTTRLYDTIVEQVEAQKVRNKTYKASLPNMVKELDPVIERWMYVLTDGQDNQSSIECYDMQQLLIQERKEGLGTIFLAANQDAEVQAVRFGFDPATALTIGADMETSTRGMSYANAMASQISAECAPTPQVRFSQLERNTSI